MSESKIPYPEGVRHEGADGLSFQCPCDPAGSNPETYISMDANIMTGWERATCGGCGRIYEFHAHISTYLTVPGEDWTTYV